VIAIVALISMILLVLGFLIWWLFFETEGVYLGKHVVIWLYDVYATRYDDIVEHDEISEHLLLAQPVMQRIAPDNDPLVLDVATGTGRIPMALCQHSRFEGHVIGLDLSRNMLAQAAQKIAAQHFEDYTTLLWISAENLPFDNNAFDVVTCMEALEFMPSAQAVIHELGRVLRPGGLLLTTQRINMPWMPDRTWDRQQMTWYLQQAGIENIEFESWQYDYKKVWGQKSGTSAFTGIRNLEEILRCPNCTQQQMYLENEAWICGNCASHAPIAEDDVIELVG